MRCSLRTMLSAALVCAPSLAYSQSPAPAPAPASREPVRAAAVGRRLSAQRATTVIRVDGALDDADWASAPIATGFVQSEPLGGQPASEQTEVRVLFNADQLYIGAYLHDRDLAHVVINDIRKDFREEDQDDFEVLLDTFGDRRNGYVFSTNIKGARHDRQVSLEGREINQSWDAVWEVQTKRVSDGWTVEMRIPFRSLRFDKTNHVAWGINFSRHLRRLNEVSFWAPVPRAFNLNRVSLAGSLDGLETGSAGRDLRVKPYIADNAVRALGTTSAPSPRMSNGVDVGVDVKAAVTSGLTMDLTVNPDFGQAEADEQQVNLTQFSQFFPEKRDFFLENSGVFYVGDAARNNRVNPTPTPDEDNLLFFSRRIGLTAGGLPIPVLGGFRLTGRLTDHTRLGILSVQDRTLGADPASNASVFRLRQNLGKIGNDIGFFAMQNIHTSGPSYANRVFGVDKNLRLFRNLDWNSYVVKTSAPRITSGDYAWRSTVNWEGNFFHGKGGLMQLGSGFQNDLGFYRRTGMRKYLADIGVRPRSVWLRAHGVREIHPHIVWDYQEDLKGGILAKRLHTGLSFFFNNGGVVEWSENPTFNRLLAPFKPNAKMASPIPVGGYNWNEHSFFYTSDQSRMFSTSTRLTFGGLYSGTQRTINSTVLFRPSYRFRASVGLQRTQAELTLPALRFTNTLTTVRSSYSFTPNMFVDALSQYDAVSKLFNANIRFNLIHHPLSDLFIVYNDQRILTPDSPVAGRALLVKFTQMVSF
jgi:hypothetical protein